MMGMDVIFVVVWAIVSSCLMLFALLMWWVARSDCRLYELRVESLRDVIADKRERIVELEGDLEEIVKVCGRRMGG